MKKNLSIILQMVCKLIISIIFLISVVNNWLSVSLVAFFSLIFIEVLFFLIKRQKNAITTLDQMLDNISYQFPLIICTFALVLNAQANYWILVAYVLMYVIISLIYYYLHLVSVRTITNSTLHLAVIPLYIAIGLSIFNSTSLINGSLDIYCLLIYILGLAIYAIGFILFIVKYAHYFKFRRKVKEHKSSK